MEIHISDRRGNKDLFCPRQQTSVWAGAGCRRNTFPTMMELWMSSRWLWLRRAWCSSPVGPLPPQSFCIFPQNGSERHIKEVVMALRELPSTQSGTGAPPSLCHPGLHRYFLPNKWLDSTTRRCAAVAQMTKTYFCPAQNLTKGTLKQSRLCRSKPEQSRRRNQTSR